MLSLGIEVCENSLQTLGVGWCWWVLHGLNLAIWPTLVAQKIWGRLISLNIHDGYMMIGINIMENPSSKMWYFSIEKPRFFSWDFPAGPRFTWRGFWAAMASNVVVALRRFLRCPWNCWKLWEELSPDDIEKIGGTYERSRPCGS